MKNTLRSTLCAFFFVNMVCYGQLTNYFKKDNYSNYRILSKDQNHMIVAAKKRYTYKDPSHRFDILKIYMTSEKKTEVLKGIIPKYKDHDGSYVSSVNVNGRYFIVMKYVFSSVSAEVVLYEFDYSGHIKSKKIIFDQGRSNDVSVVGFKSSSDNKSLIIYRRYNNQLYYNVFDLDSNTITKENHLYVPYLTSSYRLISVDGQLFYLVHYVGDNIWIHTIKDNWIDQTDKIEADVFESCNYNYEVDGNTLYLLSGMEYLNFDYMVGISAYKITPGQEILSSFHEFTKEDFDLIQFQRKSYTYFDHYDTDVQRKLVQTKDNLILTWGLQTGTTEQQTVSLWFDKSDMSLVSQQMIPRKINDKKYFSNVSTYVINDEVRGFYYDYPTNLSEKDYSKRKTVKAVKSASLIDYTQTVNKVVTKDSGKQKILPDDGDVYQYDDFVAIMCHKGKKAYWKIINK